MKSMKMIYKKFEEQDRQVREKRENSVQAYTKV